MTIFLDVNPAPGGVGIFLSVAVLFVVLAAAFIAFKLLKRTVRMAFRVAIVAIILAVGLAGSAFFYVLGTAKPVRPTPRPTPSR